MASAETVVLAVCINKCFDQEALQTIKILEHTLTVEKVFDTYHFGDGKARAKVKNSRDELFDVDTNLTLGTLVSMFGVKSLHLTCCYMSFILCGVIFTWLIKYTFLCFCIHY